MALTKDQQTRIEQLRAAFVKDGYTVAQDSFVYNGKIGMRAVSPTSIGGDTKKLKKAYYVEGSPYEVGYLMGRLAKDDIHRMAYDFVDDIVFSFLNGDKESELTKILGALMEELILYPMVEKVYPTSMPQELQDEIRGMADGGGYWCPMTKNRLWKRLKVLNLGVDVLCAHIYALNNETVSVLEAGARRKHGRTLKIDRSFFRVPVLCNAFSIFGEAAGGGHFFGRDFMFPDAGVFQDVATHIVYNPNPSADSTVSLPLVSVTAPGFAGSMAAMNSKAVAGGVDMRPAKNCSPDQVGLNSLPLVRSFIQHSSSAIAAADYIKSANRGVSWIYPISDGTNDKACVVEAGAPGFAPRPGLPPTEGYQVRWSDGLDEVKKIYEYIGKYDQMAAFMQSTEPYTAPMGYVNHSPDKGNQKTEEHNCPSGFYFAPPRWTSDPTYSQGETIMTTNQYLDPVMRLYSMEDWLSTLTGLMGNVEDDFQWRYDELNHQICGALGVDPITFKRTKSIDYATAKKLIQFLAPYPGWPCEKYYNPNGEDWKTILIGGCTSVFDLKEMIVETHAGYFGDEWMKTTLRNYLP